MWYLWYVKFVVRVKCNVNKTTISTWPQNITLMHESAFNHSRCIGSRNPLCLFYNGLLFLHSSTYFFLSVCATRSQIYKLPRIVCLLRYPLPHNIPAETHKSI